MSVYRVDPLSDPRWEEFVHGHARSSVFHTAGWLDALRRTYGYVPFALSTSPPTGPLRNAVALCQVRGWLGASRFVSLPFSDHCDPLVGAEADLAEILTILRREKTGGRGASVELRPRHTGQDGAFDRASFEPAGEYAHHTLNLAPSLEQLYRRTHRSCIRRAVRRAERAGVACETGASPALVASFYQLLCLTRRRQGLPPQPVEWFQNLVRCLGECLTIRLARVEGQPAGALLTLSFRDTVAYKYGCSDPRYHRLGVMPLLFWQTIQDARSRGARQLDLGRSDREQQGLLRFKDRLGGECSSLTYYRDTACRHRLPPSSWRGRAARRVVSRLPEPALIAAGRLLYRYFG